MKKHVALIAPVPDLSMVRNRSFHVVEAPVVHSNQEYRDFYAGEAERGAYITCDNGAWMTGESMSISDLLSAAHVVGANEVVVPDVFEDSVGTLRRAVEFLDQWSNPVIRLMIVPQGRDIHEWLESWKALTYVLDNRTATVAIPKHMERKVLGGRSAIAHAMWKRYAPNTELHLLGGTGRPRSDLDLLTQCPTIRSLDTSEPFACGQQGIDIISNEALNRTALRFDESAENSGVHNLNVYRGWLRERRLE